MASVFNIADSSISVGVALIVIFQKQFFDVAKASDLKNNKTGESAESESKRDTSTNEPISVGEKTE